MAGPSHQLHMHKQQGTWRLWCVSAPCAHAVLATGRPTPVRLCAQPITHSTDEGMLLLVQGGWELRVPCPKHRPCHPWPCLPFSLVAPRQLARPFQLSLPQLLLQMRCASGPVSPLSDLPNSIPDAAVPHHPLVRPATQLSLPRLSTIDCPRLSSTGPPPTAATSAGRRQCTWRCTPWAACPRARACPRSPAATRAQPVTCWCARARWRTLREAPHTPCPRCASCMLSEFGWV